MDKKMLEAIRNLAGSGFIVGGWELIPKVEFNNLGDVAIYAWACILASLLYVADLVLIQWGKEDK